MADYQEVEGEADEEETPKPQLTPRERVYAAVLTYKGEEFQGLKEFAAALGKFEALPQYLLRVKKLIAKTKELEKRKEQVLRLSKELFPA